MEMGIPKINTVCLSYMERTIQKRKGKSVYYQYSIFKVRITIFSRSFVWICLVLVNRLSILYFRNIILIEYTFKKFWNSFMGLAIKSILCCLSKPFLDDFSVFINNLSWTICLLGVDLCCYIYLDLIFFKEGCLFMLWILPLFSFKINDI